MLEKNDLETSISGDTDLKGILLVPPKKKTTYQCGAGCTVFQTSGNSLTDAGENFA